jgi:hypothetical protein
MQHLAHFGDEKNPTQYGMFFTANRLNWNGSFNRIGNQNILEEK